MRWGLLLAAAVAIAVGIPAMSKKHEAPSVAANAPMQPAVPMGQDYMIQPMQIRAQSASAWDTQCTDDCSGHEAGYQWAEDNEIGDADDCEGKSQSFIDGCVQYVEENKDGPEVVSAEN